MIFTVFLIPLRFFQNLQAALPSFFTIEGADLKSMIASTGGENDCFQIQNAVDTVDRIDSDDDFKLKFEGIEEIPKQNPRAVLFVQSNGIPSKSK